MKPLPTITQTIEKTEFLPSVLNPVGKEIGTALANVLHIVFSPVNWAGERLRIYEQNQISRFVEKINSAAELIPEENLMLPRTSIIGSAMENAKYCLDEPDLREMFAMLIASSLDSQKQPYIRQSFAEIIKQLEPVDAQNLKYLAKFFENEIPNPNMIKPPISFPCVNYIIKHKEGFVIVHPNFFLTKESHENYKLQSSSVTNLIRLGLVTCNFNFRLSSDLEYYIYERNPDYLELLDLYAEDNDLKPDIQKGVLMVTTLGLDFIKTCIL